MRRETRHELKSDPFAKEVMHTLDLASEHKQQLIRYGSVGLAVIVLASGAWAYMNNQRQQRQRDLAEAQKVFSTAVGPPQGVQPTFPTEQARQAAIVKAFSNVYNKYPGSTEGMIAAIILGGTAADKGDIAESEKQFRIVVDKGDVDYANMARQSLAELYASQGKMGEAEKLLRAIMDKPSATVSKDEAQLTLARLYRESDPAKAKKLCDPLRTSGTGAVNRAAITLCAEIDNPSMRNR